MNTIKSKLRARRMWTNYAPFKTGVFVSLHRTRARALVGAGGWDVMRPIPVAVIPLDDVEALVATSSAAVQSRIHRSIGKPTYGDIVRAVLISSGVLPRKEALK
jgi:hypothetical protein